MRIFLDVINKMAFKRFYEKFTPVFAIFFLKNWVIILNLAGSEVNINITNIICLHCIFFNLSIVNV